MTEVRLDAFSYPTTGPPGKNNRLHGMEIPAAGQASESNE
jgi:hypothetical protein